MAHRFMTSRITLASAVGPLSAGMLHDRFDSYAPLLLGGVVISLVSGLLIFSLGRYPDWSAPTHPEVPEPRGTMFNVGAAEGKL